MAGAPTARGSTARSRAGLAQKAARPPSPRRKGAPPKAMENCRHQNYRKVCSLLWRATSGPETRPTATALGQGPRLDPTAKRAEEGDAAQLTPRGAFGHRPGLIDRGRPKKGHRVGAFCRGHRAPQTVLALGAGARATEGRLRNVWCTIEGFTASSRVWLKSSLSRPLGRCGSGRGPVVSSL